jgi:PAS domain S-box-containing protein
MLSSSTRRIAGGCLLIAVIGIVSTSAALYFTSSNTITQMATADLSHLVDATFNMVHQATSKAVVNHLRASAERTREIVAYYYREAEAGHLTDAEARRRAAEVLLAERLGSTGYSFALDSRCVMQVHPKPGMVGSAMAAAAEPAPTICRGIITTKNGYFEYAWKNPTDPAWRKKALYTAYFEPWDWHISVTAYRDEFDHLVTPEDFRDDILSTKIGDSGYVYLLNAAGDFLIHPSLERSNIATMANPGVGREVFRDIVRHKNGQMVYPWRNPGEAAPREKIIVFKHYPDFDWYIVGGAYVDELYRPLRRIRVVAVVILVGTCLLALALSLWLGRTVVSAQKAQEMALRSALDATETIIDTVPFALVLIAEDRTIRRANEAAGKILGVAPTELVGQSWRKFLTKDQASGPAQETSVVNAEGKAVSILRTRLPVTLGGEAVVIEAFLDLTERKEMEIQLRHSQKLEAIGQLAGGIAHEINTPAQYVGDSISFLAGSLADALALFGKYRRAVATLAPAGSDQRLVQELAEAEKAADFAYLEEHALPALEQAQEGVRRISTIVSAMKEFAHPGGTEKAPADLNRAVRATLTVAHNTYKYVADLDLELGDLPPVTCNLSDINQVILNLVVNAAHAISDAVGTGGTKGRIKVRTSRQGDMARIDVEDSGNGIPETIRDRIFDPFFTTKEVGRGTGQGLTIARSIVVDRHRGSLTFQSVLGKGTTFTVLLPLDPSA